MRSSIIACDAVDPLAVGGHRRNLDVLRPYDRDHPITVAQLVVGMLGDDPRDVALYLDLPADAADDAASWLLEPTKPATQRFAGES